MHAILKMLEGGDRRSIGRSNEVVDRVLARPELFDVLIDGMLMDDALVRMRCADAAEKISAQHPQWLVAHKATLLGKLAKIEQHEVRWHVAAMLSRLPLTSRERQRVVKMLLDWTRERSSIVRTFAMQSLVAIALQDKTRVPDIRRRIEELCQTGTPAMKARGRKLLAQLNRT